jgi:hypothetical protein
MGLKVLVLAVAMGAVTAVAQQQQQQAPLEPVKCSNARGADGFTGCEKEFLNHYLSQMQPLQTQLQALSNDYNQYLRLVISQHPDMRFEAPSAQFQYGRLLPITKEPVDKKLDKKPDTKK